MKRGPRSIEFDISNLPGWVTLDKREGTLSNGQPVIDLLCEAREVPHPPRCCDAPDTRVQNRRPFTLWDEPHGLKAVRVKYMRRCFACRSCGATELLEEIVDRVPGHHMTKRAFEYAVRMSSRLTFREVARHTGQSEGTLRNVFRSAREAFYARPIRSPIHLSIDEKYFISLDEHADRRKHGLIPAKGKSVVADLGQRKIIAITDDMGWHLKTFLMSLQDRERTKVVTTDMFGGYEKMAREIYPWARQIVDRFHVVKMMGDVLEAFRLKVAAAEEKELGIKRSRLRDKSGLLLTRWHKADDRTREALERIFEKYPLLGTAYHAKEDYASIYSAAQSSNEAGDMFDRWRHHLPDEVRGTLEDGMFSKRWRPFVLAYFDDPYTNGFIEGMNTVIGDYLRAGRGYSLEVLRFKFVVSKIAIPMPDGLGDKAWIEREDIANQIFIADLLRWEREQAEDHQAWRDANVEEHISEEEMLGRICASVDWEAFVAPDLTIMVDDEERTELTFRVPDGKLTEDQLQEIFDDLGLPVAGWAFSGKIVGRELPRITEMDPSNAG